MSREGRRRKNQASPRPRAVTHAAAAATTSAWRDAMRHGRRPLTWQLAPTTCRPRLVPLPACLALPSVLGSPFTSFAAAIRRGRRWLLCTWSPQLWLQQGRSPRDWRTGICACDTYIYIYLYTGKKHRGRACVRACVLRTWSLVRLRIRASSWRFLCVCVPSRGGYNCAHGRYTHVAQSGSFDHVTNGLLFFRFRPIDRSLSVSGRWIGTFPRFSWCMSTVVVV